FASRRRHTRFSRDWSSDVCSSDLSLQITAVVAAMAHRVAAHDKAVAEHPWLDRATRYCLDAIRGKKRWHAIELAFALWLADAAGDTEAIALLGEHIPESGLVHVEGGLEDEM